MKAKRFSLSLLAALGLAASLSTAQAAEPVLVLNGSLLGATIPTINVLPTGGVPALVAGLPADVAFVNTVSGHALGTVASTVDGLGLPGTELVNTVTGTLAPVTSLVPPLTVSLTSTAVALTAPVNGITVPLVQTLDGVTVGTPLHAATELVGGLLGVPVSAGTTGPLSPALGLLGPVTGLVSGLTSNTLTSTNGLLAPVGGLLAPVTGTAGAAGGLLAPVTGLVAGLSGALPH